MKPFSATTYRNDFAFTPVVYRDFPAMPESDFIGAISEESKLVQFYRSDILYDINSFTKGAPGTIYIWIVRDSGTHLVEVSKPNAEDYINSVLDIYGDDIKMYLIEKLAGCADNQLWTLYRMSDKSMSEGEMKAHDITLLLESIASRTRNNMSFLFYNRRHINRAAKKSVYGIVSYAYKFVAEWGDKPC